ncbi:fungal-specific transcription factor domain-containing protein [Usnea florida]
MDEDTRRLPAFSTKPTNNGVPIYRTTNNANNNTSVLNTEDQAGQTNNNINPSPGTASDSSPKPQKRRNKPSLSCETCTVETETTDPSKRPLSRSSTGSSPMLLSNVPFSHPTASNIFKAEHPFSNYWTQKGGLKEVIEILPSKDQADIVITRYFDVIDPVYPMIHRESFQRDYDLFWSLPPAERPSVDGSLVALIFAMLAMGTQFVTVPSSDDKEQMAEFYVSASHQALRVFSYLGRPSLQVIQTMVLIVYFLMNDNHAADAWAFAGILIRQAYALGLNRDPSIIVPHAHPFEKQQRRKAWQAVLFQDTFLTVILKLPPTATHTDVRVEDLALEVEESLTESGATDITYLSSMWNLANIVQSTLCTPRSLSLPISSTLTQRTSLIASFHRIYMSFPVPFRTFTEASICDLARRSKRLARQTLFLTSNYFHCLMLIYADEHEQLDIDVHGTLDAAHEAINSFFLLRALFEDEAMVWYHFQHRAFSEALVIAEVVKSQYDQEAMNPIRMRAENDVLRMIGILQLSSGIDIVARTRVSVLSKYL